MHNIESPNELRARRGCCSCTSLALGGVFVVALTTFKAVFRRG